MEDTTELFNTPIAPKVQTVCTKKVWRGCGGFQKMCVILHSLVGSR